jgi:hypothetical protein
MRSGRTPRGPGRRGPRNRALFLLTGLSFGALVLPDLGLTQGGDRGVEIEDRLDVLRVDRRLLAVSADSGGILEVKLRPDEKLQFLESQGVVGVAASNERLLGATTRSSSWQEVRLRVRERKVPIERAYLGDRLALVPLQRRLLALTRGSGIWTELKLLPGETPVRVEVASGVGVCLTERRAIGVSSEGGGFSEVSLTPREKIESVSLKDQSATVQTLYRVLVFRTAEAGWTEIRRTDFLGVTRE